MIQRLWVWVPAGAAGELLIQGHILCYLWLCYLFHPHVAAAAHKRSLSFCQKCRWLVTAKHACSLHMWLSMKWCDKVFHFNIMVYTECGEMAAVSCSTSHVTTKQHCKYAILLNIKKYTIKSNSHLFRITCNKSITKVIFIIIIIIIIKTSLGKGVPFFTYP